VSATPILQVRNLKVHFPLARRMFGARRVVHAVDGVSFDVQAGKTLGIVGESGSGKTTAALAVMRLADITAGEIRLQGEEIGSLAGRALRKLRRRIQMIFQDPYSSLDPRTRASALVREPLDLMEIGAPSERDARVRELFAQVGLRSDQMGLFPHQFSGGQRQRLGIARALATKPDLIVCDEPVSALDVAIQAQILNLLIKLQAENGLSYLFISHDLGVVQYVCDEVAVMYLGQIVERASCETLFADPLHPYTWALISAVPRLGRRRRGADRIRVPGDPPSPIDPPKGCRFAGRCPFVVERCRNVSPELRTLASGHAVRCHLVEEDGRVPHRPVAL
jgi:peptide/nickel transport system ATP-binding protein